MVWSCQLIKLKVLSVNDDDDDDDDDDAGNGRTEEHGRQTTNAERTE